MRVRGPTLRQCPGRVGQDDAEGEFPDVAGRPEAERVAGLDAHLVAPGEAVGADPVDPVEVAQDPVDLAEPLDVQPGAAVDPGAPAARSGHLDAGAGEVAQGVEVEAGPVVEAEVPVGAGGVLAPGPAAAEHDADDARHPCQPVGHGFDDRVHGEHAFLSGQ